MNDLLALVSLREQLEDRSDLTSPSSSPCDVVKSNDSSHRSVTIPILHNARGSVISVDQDRVERSEDLNPFNRLALVTVSDDDS